MSQSHPPIPEPQPHPDPVPAQDPEADDPRTQSILLPPSQRQTDQPADWTSPAEPLSPGRPLPGQPLPPPPGTNEIPAQVAEPAYEAAYEPGPAAAAPPYDPAMPAQPTGPVDFVPGFGERPSGTPTGSSAAHAGPPPVPGPATAAGPTAAAGSHQGAHSGTHPGTHPGFRVEDAPGGRRRSPLAALQGAGRGGTALAALVLGVVALILLELGLALDYGTRSLWDVVPTWSAFATVAAVVVVLAGVAGLTGRLPARTAWRVGAVGVAGLASFWVLVALPLAASDRGFWLTVALAAAGAALWLTPGRTGTPGRTE